MKVKLTLQEKQQIYRQAQSKAVTEFCRWEEEQKESLWSRFIPIPEFVKKSVLSKIVNKHIEKLTQKAIAAKEIEQLPEWKKVFPEKEVKQELTELQKLKQEFRERRNRNDDRDR